MVHLSVFDILGREVSILVNGNLKAGSYEAEWDASYFPSGVYYYQLSATGGVSSEQLTTYKETKKMVLVK